MRDYNAQLMEYKIPKDSLKKDEKANNFKQN